MIISLLVLFFKIADDTEYPDFLRFDAIQKIQYLAGSVRPKTKHNEQSTGGQSLHSQRPKKTGKLFGFNCATSIAAQRTTRLKIKDLSTSEMNIFREKEGKKEKSE